MVSDKDFQKFEGGMFKPYFEKYIEYKRGKGEKVASSTTRRLRTLNHDLGACDVLKIDPTMVEKLLSPENSASEAERQCRVSDLRQFSEFLRMFGIESAPVHPKYTKPVRGKFRPYIFTEDELERIVHAADHLPYGRRSHGHVRVYPVISRILIGTGMRIGEVISLKASDVEVDQGVIKAINGKNNISRYIPVSDSLGKVLGDYVRNQGAMPECQPLFVSPYTRREYSYHVRKDIYERRHIRVRGKGSEHPLHPPYLLHAEFGKNAFFGHGRV